ncbi:formate dehydrogenase subunit alpha [Ammoniphilus oxalaticus]|uniref:Formate dehydrogenase subunit alpha n=2 Tax=Ammoniphilus oxalaticus TaxID=66863 RepID=A0A419SEZ7_9BACL|nr:formate dehydrogenase subunit alpha [Ammoniphilus oxalaticus]
MGWGYVYSNKRIKEPLIRKNGKLTPASWDEALDLIAKQFTTIRDTHGPNALGCFSSSRSTNELNFIAGKFMRTVIGTNNIDSCNRTCHAPSVTGLVEVFGTGASTTSYDELEETDVIIAWGSNTQECHPIVFNHMRRGIRNGAKMVVVDPREIAQTRLAHKWLPIKVGYDVTLANAMGHVIIEEGLENRAFLERATLDFESYKQHTQKYTPEYAEEITGVPADDIREVARLYAQADKAIICWTLGITEHANGTENVFSLINLALLTGHIGKRGSGVNPLRGQNNVQGGGDMGALPNRSVGGWLYNDATGRQLHEEVWGAPIPEQLGLNLTEMQEAIDNEDIKALYVIGENPVQADADANHVEQLLKKLDFMVVQDILMTKTAELADVVLPAAGWAENDGTFTNSERRIQRVRPAIQPPGLAKQDHFIVQDIANRMGANWNYQSAEDIWEEIRRLAPDFAGVTYDRLDDGGLQWPCPEESHPGTPFIHGRLWKEHVEQKASFKPVDNRDPVELPDDEYPLQLTTGRRLEFYNTGVQTSDYKKVRDPEESLEIHPEDAAAYQLEDGAPVKVRSRRGEVETKVKISKRQPRGLVFMTFHFPEQTDTNRLTINATCPLAGTAEYKACAVQVERIG